MPQPPQQQAVDPPLRKPVAEAHSPNFRDGYYVEMVDRLDDAYQKFAPMRRGMPYATWTGARQEVIDQFTASPLYFVKEVTPLGGVDVRGMASDRYILLYWASDTLADNAFNAEITYDAESVATPIYARRDNIRRELYEANPTVATGTALTVLLGIKVTAAGTGYVNTDTVNIGGGGGAKAEMVVDANGGISAIIVTKEGSGYDSAALPAITFTSATGTGATAVAIVQPKTAVLVSQKKLELQDDDPYAREFVQVIRVYQTLPGPVLQGQDYNRQFSFPIPFTEQTTAAGSHIGNDLLEITPIDTVQQKEKTVNITAFQAVADAYILLFSDVADIPLPDVLSSVTSIKNESFGEGAGSVSGASSTSGDHGSFALSIPTSNQSSAAVSYELNIIVISGRERGRNKPVKRGVVMMPEGFTDTDLATHIATLTGLTVNPWPNFQPQTESFVVKGMSVAVQTEAQTSTHLSFDKTSNSTGVTAGTSYSYRTGVQSGPVRIGPTIHDSISIGGDGTSASRSVNSTASSSQSGTLPVSAGPITRSATASASVTPTSLSATPGQATYPVSGYRLISQNAEPLMYHRIMVHFEMYDFGGL